MKYECQYCKKLFSRPPQNRHFKQCESYRDSHPEEFPPDCVCEHRSTSITQMKRHRAGCGVWKTRDIGAIAQERTRATFERKYGPGVTNAIHIESARIKKASTMTERYGAPNPFSRESSLFGKVQAHWDGKDRTSHLPKDNFAKPEIKEKIRQYWQKNHGVDNGTQVPEIRAKQLATTLSRYGGEHCLKVPEIRAKGVESIRARFGVDDAAQSPDVLEKIRQTNLSRYGVEWTTQDPETREKMSSSLVFLLSTPEGRQIYRDTHNEEAYRQTCLIRYGATHPMKNRDYARNHLEHSRRAGPNSLERRFQELFPQFLFTGDGSYWRFLPLLNKNKNPDFLLPGPDPDNPFHDVGKVVEIFGMYWHSEAITGKSADQHEVETIEAWSEVGLKCLVFWESEFGDEPKISEKMRSFL